VKWSVSDSGFGIPREDLPRIFDPYFTTKDRGSEKGMGLGLSICYSIIKRHRGLIVAESAPGAGSTFSVYLPASFASRVGQEKRDVTTGPLSRSGESHAGKILVMDDEDYILDMLRDMLSALGFGVETAKNGTEAVALYETTSHKEPFVATILDLEVPDGRGGLFAIERLRKIDPEVKAIIISGFSNDPVLADFRFHGFRGAIVKPFTLKTLSQVLYEVIGRRLT
jgi:CheY-like chemotaxis protein